MDFPFSCMISPYISTNIDHKKAYGTPFSSPCNYKQTTELFTSASGGELVTFAWLALPPETTLHKHDKITLPDGSEPYVRSFYTNYRPSDADEIDHITVNLSDRTTGDDN